MEIPSELIYLYGAQFAFSLVMAVLFWRIRRGASPNLSIFARWIWWALLGLTGASLASAFDYQGHPTWAVGFATLLGWFLIENVYTWLVVSTISRSDLPLFPRFMANPAGSEWPSVEPYLSLRAWLRKNDFTLTQSLIAKHQEEVSIRLIVFDRKDNHVRVSLLFFPHREGPGAYAATFQSHFENDTRLITDNFFLPYGGFYPENWSVERRPRLRSLEKLYTRHLARCDAMATPMLENKLEPLEDLNKANRLIEQLNRELGFLNFPDEEDDHRISSAGRSRIWREIWTLAYFGIARKY